MTEHKKISHQTHIPLSIQLSPTIQTQYNFPFTNTWTISTINTQGLKDPIKQNLWFTFIAQSNIDIIIYIKTNYNDQEAKHWQISGYNSFWHNLETQQIGNGIEISFKQKIAQHIFKTQFWDSQTLCYDLFFPYKRYLKIISIYFLATDS
jgi:hypothetical protein